MFLSLCFCLQVENYAIYSALFLSCTIAAVMDPPPAMDCERREFDGDYEKYRCEVAKRVAAYALIASVAMHFLAIILAMGEFLVIFGYFWLFSYGQLY